jgi:ankyrin repeat protein
MEPVSIVSLVAGCATIAARIVISLKDIHDYHQSYRNTADNIRFLLSDVENAKHILLAIKATIIADEGTVLRIQQSSLETCTHVLERIEKFAEKHKRTRSGLKAQISRVRFTWEESDIKPLRAELHNQIQYLKWIQDTATTDGNETPPAVDATISEPIPAITPERNISELLIDAAKSADTEAIKTYLQANANVDFRSRVAHHDCNGRAAIHFVAKTGPLAALEALIEANADADLTEPLERETAIHIAASNGQLAIVRYLVSKNVNLDAQNLYGQTPLVVATTEAIQTTLLNAGASPNITSADDIPVLHKAIRLGSVGTIRKLVEKRANVNALDADGYSPLRLAYDHSGIPESKISDIIEILLLSSATQNTISDEIKESLLYSAIRDHRPQVVRAILNTGADVLSEQRSNGLLPLHVAARDAPECVLKELLRYTQCVDIRDQATGQTPLHHAIASGNEENVRALLEWMPTLCLGDSNLLAPIHLAFRSPSISIAEIIIKAHLTRGISIYMTESIHGRLPVHLTCDPKMVALWARYIEGPFNFQYGYKLRGSQQLRRSVLHYSVLYQSSHIVEAMFEHGATINVLDNHKRNPMEALCAEESVWKRKSEIGASGFCDRLAVLKILMKHGRFTNSCRDAISKWKDHSLQTALGKELPWRNTAEMAQVAASWTIKTGGALVILGVVAFFQAAAKTQERLNGR